MLVDARLVCECISSYDGLVGLHGDARVGGDHLGGAHDLAGVDVTVDGEVGGPRPERHHYLLEGGVARTLAQRVERHLHLGSRGGVW